MSSRLPTLSKESDDVSTYNPGDRGLSHCETDCNAPPEHLGKLSTAVCRWQRAEKNSIKPTGISDADYKARDQIVANIPVREWMLSGHFLTWKTRAVINVLNLLIILLTQIEYWVKLIQ